MKKTKVINLLMVLLLFFHGFLVIPATAFDGEEKAPKIKIEKNGSITNVFVDGDDALVSIIRQVYTLIYSDFVNIDEIENSIDDLPPPYLLLLANKYCSVDFEKAIDYTMLASFRMRYDANRCVDKTAMNSISMVLSTLSMKKCAEKMEFTKEETMNHSKKSISRLLSSNMLKAGNASPWWICSGGMNVIQAALKQETISQSDWLVPSSQWGKIRDELVNQFKQLIVTEK